MSTPQKRGPKATSLEQRFRNRIAGIQPTITGCILWPGGRNRDGYGYIRDYDLKLHLTHRLAYRLSSGPIPDRMVVMHTCDRPACVNPEHLKLGTQAENVRDMDSKGRRNPAFGDSNGSRTCPEARPKGATHWSKVRPTEVTRGERHGMSKVTSSDVVKIRTLYRLRIFDQPQLAARFGLNQGNISAITSGRTWSAVPDYLTPTT